MRKMKKWVKKVTDPGSNKWPPVWMSDAPRHGQSLDFISSSNADYHCNLWHYYVSGGGLWGSDTKVWSWPLSLGAGCCAQHVCSKWSTILWSLTEILINSFANKLLDETLSHCTGWQTNGRAGIITRLHHCPQRTKFISLDTTAVQVS